MRSMIEAMIDAVAVNVERGQRLHPLARYAARPYVANCECTVFDFVAAPVEDLTDDYGCPSCGTPMTPLGPPGVPRSRGRVRT